MTKSIIFYASASFIGGLLIGYYLGRKKGTRVVEPEMTEESEETKEERPEEANEEPEEVNEDSKVVSNTANIATPENPGVDYTAYVKKVEEVKYAHPTDGDDTELEDEEDIDPPMETYEERIDRENREINEEMIAYKKRKGHQIDILGKEPVDDKYPNVTYRQEYLLYFMQDDILSDQEGRVVDEKELLGDKLRRFGWFQNKEEQVWVRNNIEEIDYNVEKYNTTYEDYFGHPVEEDDEE